MAATCSAAGAGQLDEPVGELSCEQPADQSRDEDDSSRSKQYPGAELFEEVLRLGQKARDLQRTAPVRSRGHCRR